VDRRELKQLVREVLIELLLEPQPESSDWVDLPKAWQPLGYPSYDALYKDVQRGLFRQGKEVCDRRKPGAKLAKLQINLTAARKRLMEDPSKRRGL
jgi:hypothetical protein